MRARLTLNAAGPWADYLQNDPEHFGAWRRLPFSRDAYFIVDRAPTSEYGIAMQGLSRDKDAVLGRATRHLFAAPWRDKTLIGVWHSLFPEFPDAAYVQPDEIEEWMAELNTVYPTLQLSPAEVTFAHCGLVPFGETATATELSFGKESRLIDHRRARCAGLVSLVGIRFTMARVDAARALDLLLRQLPMRHRRRHRALAASRRRDRRFCSVRGGGLRMPAGVNVDSLQRCCAITAPLRAVLRRGAGADTAPHSRHEHADRRNSFRGEQEMAVQLDDVVMRRTDLAAGSHPGRAHWSQQP